MKYLFILLPFFSLGASAQISEADTLRSPNISIHKDYRLDVLSQKDSDINTAILKTKARTMKGYRLMVLNTNDKDFAFKTRTELLQKFPEQKLYMWYANPYIRLKFGNFKSKEEAESYRKEISRMLNGANIYLLQEKIEVNPGDDFDPDTMRDKI